MCGPKASQTAGLSNGEKNSFLIQHCSQELFVGDSGLFEVELVVVTASVSCGVAAKLIRPLLAGEALCACLGWWQYWDDWLPG